MHIISYHSSQNTHSLFYASSNYKFLIKNKKKKQKTKEEHTPNCDGAFAGGPWKYLRPTFAGGPVYKIYDLAL